MGVDGVRVAPRGRGRRRRPCASRLYILGFSDTFYRLGAALIVALIATLLLKKPSHLEAGAGH